MFKTTQQHYVVTNENCSSTHLSRLDFSSQYSRTLVYTYNGVGNITAYTHVPEMFDTTKTLRASTFTPHYCKTFSNKYLANIFQLSTTSSR